jgi:hypothetical protein
MISIPQSLCCARNWLSCILSTAAISISRSRSLKMPKQKAPNSSVTAAAVGWAYYKLGSIDLAITELKECTQNQIPSLGTIREGLYDRPAFRSCRAISASRPQGSSEFFRATARYLGLSVSDWGTGCKPSATLLHLPKRVSVLNASIIAGEEIALFCV